MELELKIKDRLAKVERLKNSGNKMNFKVDDKEYEIDLVRLADGLYSAIYRGKSYNVQMVQGITNKHFTVNTIYSTYEVEVIDAESKYRHSRQKDDGFNQGNSILSPMPGKVVKILVKEGDEVEAGQTVIILSAMKMESEFKAGKPGKVKAIHVKEGDLVEGNKVMMIIE
jgi:biotin carboxyl carrier protein